MLRNTIAIEDFDLSKTSKAKHKQVINRYIDALKDDPTATKRHAAILARGIEKDILEKFFIEGWTVQRISRAFKLSRNTIQKFIEDYLLRHYDDTVVEQVATMGMENHLGIVNTFFATALYVAREAAFNAIYLQKIREKVARKLAEEGLEATIADKDLMRSWDVASARLDRYTRLANEHLKTYLQLLEKVLDAQRDVAFARVVLDYINRLDPEVGAKLKELMAQDEYAKAIFSSLSGKALVSAFKDRTSPERFMEMVESEAQKLEEIIDVPALPITENKDNKPVDDLEDTDGEAEKEE